MQTQYSTNLPSWLWATLIVIGGIYWIWRSVHYYRKRKMTKKAEKVISTLNKAAEESHK